MKRLLSLCLALSVCLLGASARAGKEPAASFVAFESTTMSRDVAAAAGQPAAFPVADGLKFKVEVQVTKGALSTLANDPLLHQQMLDAVQGVYRKLVDKLGAAYKDADALVRSKPGEFDTAFTVMVNATNAQISAHIDEAQRAAQKAFDDLAKTKKEYRGYQIKTVASISIGAAALITNIGILASSPFSFGAGAVIAIVGLAKSSVALSKNIVLASQEVEKTLASVHGKLDKIRGDFDKSQAAAAAKQTAGVITEAVLGQSILPTLSECSKLLDAADGKLKGIDVSAHKIAENLNKILEKSEKLQGKIRADGKLAINREAPQAPRSINTDKLAVLQKAAAGSIESVGKQLTRLSARRAEFEQFKAQADQIKKEQKNLVKALAVLEGILKLKDIALSPVDAATFTDIVKIVGPAAGELILDKGVETAIGSAQGDK